MRLEHRANIAARTTPKRRKNNTQAPRVLIASRARALVDVEIVPDHHITGFELWRQLGGHINVESLAIDGALNHVH